MTLKNRLIAGCIINLGFQPIFVPVLLLKWYLHSGNPMNYFLLWLIGTWIMFFLGTIILLDYD